MDLQIKMKKAKLKKSVNHSVNQTSIYLLLSRNKICQ